MVATAIARGPEAVGGQITVEAIQHTLNPETDTIVYNQITTSKFALDGGPVEINVTETGNESFVLFSGSVDCYTSTGTL
jgi:hypothetical protein